MREIKFKGKRIDSSEWVEGNLVWSEDADEEYRAIIIPKTESNMFLSSNEGDLWFETWYLIDPDTVCQYTGLKDKNGVEIFEGDICVIIAMDVCEEDGYFVVRWDNDEAQYNLEGDRLTLCFNNVYSYECEVVGNIWDNPELLGRRNDRE